MASRLCTEVVSRNSGCRIKFLSFSLAFTLLSASAFLSAPAIAGSGEVTLIHMGDVHGHLVPRANVRSDTTGRVEGGAARMYTKIKELRRDATENGVNHSLLINTGDTLQGSGEALFTRGQAMIDVINLFGIDAFAPGNWDFLYGPARFEETFKGTTTAPPLANWKAMASNLYYTTKFDDAAVCGITGVDATTGTTRPRMRVLPPYTVKTVGKVKVGILGMTTARAIAAIGPKVTAGFQFTDGNVEYPCYIDVLRNQEKVDVVVMISELEMSRDIKLAESHAGVDVILNSDMHERTVAPIVTSKGTRIVEEGQDGTMIGEMELKVTNGVVTAFEWKAHIITDRIAEDKTIAAKVTAVRKPFVKATFVKGQTVTVGGNTTKLLRPVDEVIAYTQVALHRSNFMNEDMPGVVEGSSHDLIVDAMRWGSKSSGAALRGFRYGTHIPAGGAILMQDIYHYIPVAAKVGRSPTACGFDMKLQVENSTDGTFNPDPNKWTGGWMFAYSNASFDLDACAGYLGDGATERGTNIKVGGVLVDPLDKFDPLTNRCVSGTPSFSVSGYWYADDPNTLNNCPQCRGRLIEVMKADGTVATAADPALTTNPPLDSSAMMDVTESVVQYLRAPASSGGLGGVVTSTNLQLHRINVKRLPNINPFPFNVVQPLLGATLATCPPKP